VRQVVTLLSTHCNWVTEQRLLETNWDRLQRRSFNLYDVAELYHENSKMKPYQLFETALSTDIFRQPAVIEGCTKINKAYPSAKVTPLPTRGLEVRRYFSEVVMNRRSHRRFRNVPMSLLHLSSILYHANGISGRMDFREMHTGRVMTQYFRNTPSGGGLYPVETYVVPLNVRGLSRGAYHYNVFAHALETLREDFDQDQFLGLFPIHPDIVRIDEASLVLLLSGTFDRTAGKYGARGYRYVLQESGHLCQNAWIAATALGYGAVSLAGFLDDPASEWLGLDGRDEAVIYALVCGTPATVPAKPIRPGELMSKGPRARKTGEVSVDAQDSSGW